MTPQPVGVPTRRLATLLCIALLAWAVWLGGGALAAGGQVESRCSLEGRALNAVTGQPVGGVPLTLSRVDGSGKPLKVSSESGGRFVFEGFEPGGYQLFAERTGIYSRQAYDARRSPLQGTALAISAGEEAKGLVFKMIPNATISGTVLDEDGEAFSGGVSALRYEYRRGRRYLAPVAGSLVGVGGRFQIDSLWPGQYILVAQPTNPVFATTVAIDGPLPVLPELRGVTTYYPASRESSGAAPQDVDMGADVRVDFRLLSENTVRVRGKVSAISEEGGAVEGRPSFAVRLSERSMNEVIDAVLSASSATVWPDGLFEIKGVTPGSYLLSAAGPPGQRAAMIVDIGNQHIDNLEVRLERGRDLSGSVGPAGSAAVRVSLEPLDVPGGLFPRPSATADANGKLTFTQVFPVRYWVDVAGIPENGYLRSVTLGGRDLTEEPLDLSNGVAGTLRVELGGPSARLEGEVSERAGQPRAGVTVALIPVSGRPLLYRSTTTDAKGGFRFNGVTPGDYTVLAGNDLGGEAFRDPKLVRGFEKQAISVSLKENERKKVTVAAIGLNGPASGAEVK